MSWNGFQNLDLSGVEADDYMPISQPGLYHLRCIGYELKTGANKINKRLVLTLEDTVGGGQLKAGFNIVHSSSPKAQEIALRQLKSFLISGGHPNPDHPGDLDTLKGLTPTAYLDFGKPYTDSDGNQRTPIEVKRFVLPGEDATPPPPSQAPVANGHAGSGGPALDDEIPF